MVDLILWLGDRLEIGIPIVLVLAVGTLLLGHYWRALRRAASKARAVGQGDDGQLVVMDGNRVRGDVRVSQRRG